MSVVVQIDIAGGSARRTLTITNVSPTLDLDEAGRRSHDQECEYVATCKGGRLIVSRFTHRYGDDVLALIARAGEALRNEHGFI